MINEISLFFSKDTNKKFLGSFLISFLFVFSVLIINQLLLLSWVFKEYQPAFSQGFILLLYSLPSIVVMCLPFAVCIGFTYGLIKNNFLEIFLTNKGKIIPVLILGLIISVLGFVFSDLIMPNSNKNFTELYRAITFEAKPSIESPREMTSLELISKMSETDEKTNFYKIELNKKYSIPLGALFFACFSISLSLVLGKRIKTAVCISLISCIVYWAFILYGQNFSVKNGNYGALAMWLPNVFFLFVSAILYMIKCKINRPRPCGRLA